MIDLIRSEDRGTAATCPSDWGNSTATLQGEAALTLIATQNSELLLFDRA